MPTLSSVPEEKKLTLADHYNCEAMKIASMPGGGTTIGEVHDAIEKHVNQQIKSVLDELEGESHNIHSGFGKCVPLSTIQKIRSRYE